MRPPRLEPPDLLPDDLVEPPLDLEKDDDLDDDDLEKLDDLLFDLDRLLLLYDLLFRFVLEGLER